MSPFAYFTVLVSVVVGLLVWFVGPVSAQRSIEVLDSFGRPIPAVRIDVFGRGELIAVHSTSEEGWAELASDRWSDVRRVSLSHLGFRTRIVQVEELPSDGVIRLEPEALPIDGLSVTGRELCPIDATDEARQLWSEMASLYSSETESRALSAFVSRRSGPVRETDLYRPAEEDMSEYVVAWDGGVWHGDDLHAKPLSVRAISEGYAWEPVDIGGIRDPGEWRYADLHQASAHHFANPAFGELHDFAIENESEGITTLVFCPRGNGDRGSVRGVVRLNPEVGFLNADWRFKVPERDEGAGGSVEFFALAEASDARPHLMAARGIFFRHSGREPPYPELPRSYGRESVEVTGWTVHPAWSHPCGSEPVEAGGVPGGGRFNVYSLQPRTPELIAFRECVDLNWGSGPR